MQERIYSARKEIAGSKKRRRREKKLLVSQCGGDFIYHGGWTKTNAGIMTLYFVQSSQSARKGSVFKLWYPPGTYTINRFL